ncbi:hypothetical protein ACP70R_029199 [Stipagrostis hirtigluma subsp. patula]
MGSLGPTEFALQPKGGKPAGGEQQQQQQGGSCGGCGFQMPLHYPRYRKADYEAMPEWRLDCLLREYGLPVAGDLHAKRRFAMGAFLWPDQY